MLARRLQPRRLELLDQVRDRLVLARRAGRTALERIGGEGARDVGHPLHVDVRSRLPAASVSSDASPMNSGAFMMSLPTRS